MDGDRLALIICLAIGAAVVRGIFAAIGSPAERAARELADIDERRRRLIFAEEAAIRCEERASALVDEFPSATEEQILTLMRDELINMRSPYPQYFAWLTLENVARVRRTRLLQRMRAQRDQAKLQD